MSADIINGKKISQEILSEIKNEVNKLKSKHSIVPRLATILVGENPASISYVQEK